MRRWNLKKQRLKSIKIRNYTLKILLRNLKMVIRACRDRFLSSKRNWVKVKIWCRSGIKPSHRRSKSWGYFKRSSKRHRLRYFRITQPLRSSRQAWQRPRSTLLERYLTTEAAHIIPQLHLQLIIKDNSRTRKQMVALRLCRNIWKRMTQESLLAPLTGCQLMTSLTFSNSRPQPPLQDFKSRTSKSKTKTLPSNQAPTTSNPQFRSQSPWLMTNSLHTPVPSKSVSHWQTITPTNLAKVQILQR
jgi:hypothetical protein